METTTARRRRTVQPITRAWNVAKKYRHTYSYEDMERNIHDTFFAIYAIERTLRRRKLDKMPTKKGVFIKNGKMVIVK